MSATGNESGEPAPRRSSRNRTQRNANPCDFLDVAKEDASATSPSKETRLEKPTVHGERHWRFGDKTFDEFSTVDGEKIMLSNRWTGVRSVGWNAAGALEKGGRELVAKQGHAVLLKTMQHHNDDCYVLAEAWRTLTNIVIHAMNTTLDEEIAAHGLDFVCQSLLHFNDCTLVPIQARGLTLLTHLCYRSPDNLEQLTQTQNLEIIHHVLRTWKNDEKVQAAGEKLVQQISHSGVSLQQSKRRGSSRASSRSSSRRGRLFPPQTAVISEIQNDRGLDVIVDATMY